ncbi:MAG TPA: hypothetical protein VLY04_21085 [Bryobacteraceae bacterium]|nr:hypothetical protein [Bryobacteraceae bacterium]
MNIVLVHGVLGFSQLDLGLGKIEYFAGVAEHLRQRFQASVCAPALDPTQGTEVRSGQLRNAIGEALRTGQLNPAEPIDIIAHSLGGLDSRRMIATNPFIEAGGNNVPVRTLATISTPHRGSPIADVIALKFLPKLPGIEAVLQGADAALQRVLDHFKISLECLHDLTSESANQFNAEFPDQRGVRYRSFAGCGRDGFPPTCAFFLPYYEYIRLHTKGLDQSDGMVTVSSAMWADFDQNLWPCDHADEIGHDLDHPLQGVTAQALERFDRIVSGF